MSDKYFQTRSKTFAYAIQYVTERKFYVFNDELGAKIYSFKADGKLFEKIKELENLKYDL